MRWPLLDHAEVKVIEWLAGFIKDPKDETPVYRVHSIKRALAPYRHSFAEGCCLIHAYLIQLSQGSARGCCCCCWLFEHCRWPFEHWFGLGLSFGQPLGEDCRQHRAELSKGNAKNKLLALADGSPPAADAFGGTFPAGAAAASPYLARHSVKILAAYSRHVFMSFASDE